MQTFPNACMFTAACKVTLLTETCAQSIQESVRQAREWYLKILKKSNKLRVFQVASLFEMSKCMWRDCYLWIHMRCIVLKQWCRCSDGSDNSAVSFWSFIWLAMILTVGGSKLHRNDWQTEFLFNSRSEVHVSFLHSCFMSLKNVCFHLHSPSHWHAPRSIPNSGFFSCLILSQSVFVWTFLMLNTWINFILHCVNHKAVNTWMYTTSQGLFIFLLVTKNILRKLIIFRNTSKLLWRYYWRRASFAFAEVRQSK